MRMLRFLLRRSSSEKPLDVPATARTFTYHKKSGISAIVVALLLASIVELTVVHYFVAKLSDVLAWVLTISSVWVSLTIVAQIRTLGWRPHFIDDGRLVVRNGMFDLAEIQLANIERIERSTKTPKPESKPADAKVPMPLQTSVPVGHNVVVYLVEDVQATLLYGKRRPFRVALLYADEPAELCKSVMDSKTAG